MNLPEEQRTRGKPNEPDISKSFVNPTKANKTDPGMIRDRPNTPKHLILPGLRVKRKVRPKVTKPKKVRLKGTRYAARQKGMCRYHSFLT